MLRNGSDIFNLNNKKLKLKLVKKENNENENETEKISKISENEDNNILNKEDLINQINNLKQKIISLETIIQEKDSKIFSLSKTNEKLTNNFEMINKYLTEILDKKARKQLRKKIN